MGYNVKGVERLCQSLGGEFKGDGQLFDCNLKSEAAKSEFWDKVKEYEE